MEQDHSYHICLGIPIPKCVQTLPRIPPVSFHHHGDILSLEILRNFGKEFDIPCDEIDQACNLASGPSDVVIILERPRSRKYHNYRHPFPKFVDNCRTLWAVDELIRYATKGARSIHTVTVLDAFSFKPKWKKNIPDVQCHQLLAEILRAKRPKVVIRCHADEYEDLWMKQFELPGEDYKYVRKEIQVVENHTTVVLQSFHPSKAVNDADKGPQYRCLLIYHFIAAFSELSGVAQLHEDAEEIWKLCNMKYQRKRPSNPNWSAQIYLTIALQWRYEGYQGSCQIFSREYSDRQELKSQAKIISTMYNWLRHLAGQSSTFGALGIAEAVLFLWKKYFTTNPLYKQVTSLLLLRGSEQQAWFPTADHRLSIDEDLSKLQITSSKRPGWMSVELDSPEISKVNKQAITRISAALLRLEEGEEVVTPNPVDKLNQASYTEIAELLEKHNLLINEELQKSTLPQLYGALIVCDLATQCGFLAQIIKSSNFSDEPKEEKHKDLILLREYLRQLVATET